MAKTRNTTKIMWLFGASVLILAVVTLFLAIGGTQQQTVTTDTTKGLTDAITQSGQSNFCGNNPSLSAAIRIRNMGAPSTEYINGTTVLVVDENTGKVISYATDGSSSGTYDTLSSVFDCNAKNNYKIYIKTAQDSTNAAFFGEVNKKRTYGYALVTPQDLTTTPIYIDLEATNHSLLKVKAYDLANTAWMYNGTNTALSYISFAGTADGINLSFNNDTSKSFGLGDELNVRLTLAPETVNEVGGRNALLSVKYSDENNVNDWNKDTLELTFDSVSLGSSMEYSEDVDTGSGLSGYQKTYMLSHPVGMNAPDLTNNRVGDKKATSELLFKITASSTVNPDFSPTLRYTELGDYQSDLDSNNMRINRAFRDDSSHTAIGSATVQKMVFAIV